MPDMPLSLVDPNTPTTEPPPLSPEDQKAQDEIFVYKDALTHIREIKRAFLPEVEVTKANRERRRVNIDLAAEREAGRIRKSDVLVPMRVIEEAITREKPGFIAYLQQSRRLAIFIDRLQPNDEHDALEQAFTRGMTYDNWIIAHHKTIDGAQTHGWDWYEVLYDASKPLHCTIEHVGHDRLYFPLDTEDIQNCARILREYKLTKTQLDYFVKQFDFDPAQVQKIIAMKGQGSIDSGMVKDHTYSVFKQYCKLDGIVYVSWLSFDGTDDWLKAPDKFYNGVDTQVMAQVPQSDAMAPYPLDPSQMVSMPQPPKQELQWKPKDETLYPTVLLPYEETEQKEIQSRKGRVFKDKYKQEVMTTGWSAFLNGMNRATWVIPYKDQQDGKSISEMESIEIADGKAIPMKVGFLSMPYPPPQMIEMLQAFDSKIATAAGQMTYAVQSKTSGARTTATEVESSEKDTNLLASVNLTLFASCLHEVLKRAWIIVQSQALQGLINLYGSYTQTQNPVTGESDMVFQNDMETIAKDFDIRPAGDVDVIQRQELLDNMMKFWPVVQNTPIAMDFLSQLLRIQFAEKGDVWAQQLQQGDPKILLGEYYKIMSAAIANPQELMQIDPQHKMILQQLLMQTQQMLGTTQQPTNGNTTTQQGNGATRPTAGGMATASTNAGANQPSAGTQNQAVAA